jgi:hypothetical protein
MSKKFLRKKSVAKRYDVDERTVDRMKDDGRLPKPIYRGRLPMWAEDALDASDREATKRSRPDRANSELIAVQHTQLTKGATRADIAMPRITHGSLGLGAVRLARAGEIMGIAEGVESGLSAQQIHDVPVWCCLGAARMHRVAIPNLVRDLRIFADTDDHGRLAAERTQAAHTSRRVTIVYPPGEHNDWNDALRAGCVS